MKKNEIGLTKKSYDILKYFEKHEDLLTSEVIEYSLFLFDYLYKKDPILLIKMFDDVINEIQLNYFNG